jgi:hypothetical protein
MGNQLPRKATRRYASTVVVSLLRERTLTTYQRKIRTPGVTL